MGMDKKLLDKKKPTSRSSRAGLQFPVGRVHRLLKVMRVRNLPFIEREMPRSNVDQMSPHLHSPVSLPMVVSVPPPLSTPLPSWVRSLCPLNPSAKFLTRRTSCRVPDRRGAGAGWKRLQGPQGSSNLLHLNLRAFPDTTLCSLSTLNSHRSSVSRPAICSSPFAEMRSSTP